MTTAAPPRNAARPPGSGTPVPSPAELRFRACVAKVLLFEGGYVDHPKDPGGCTNLGITRATLERWRREAVDCAAVRALGVAEATAIYRAHYWNAVRGDELPAGVDLVVFDAAVNSGRRRAVEWLQEALLLNQVDGAIGPVTLGAVARHPDRAALVEAMIALRLRFLRGLRTFDTFGRGWTRRVEAVRRQAGKAVVAAAASRHTLERAR